MILQCGSLVTLCFRIIHVRPQRVCIPGMCTKWGSSAWLSSFASENTRALYEKVLDLFWEWVESRYSPPRGVEPYAWLRDHRDEVKPGSDDPLHCERIVAAWYVSLGSMDLAESSAATYRAVLSATFERLLPRHAGVLRLPLEPSDGVS